MANNIKEVEKILKDNGFNSSDYVMSLQGPTLIMTESGNIKMNGNLDVKIDIIGLIKIM